MSQGCWGAAAAAEVGREHRIFSQGQELLLICWLPPLTLKHRTGTALTIRTPEKGAEGSLQTWREQHPRQRKAAVPPAPWKEGKNTLFLPNLTKLPWARGVRPHNPLSLDDTSLPESRVKKSDSQQFEPF